MKAKVGVRTMTLPARPSLRTAELEPFSGSHAIGAGIGSGDGGDRDHNKQISIRILHLRAKFSERPDMKEF